MLTLQPLSSPGLSTTRWSRSVLWRHPLQGLWVAPGTPPSQKLTTGLSCAGRPTSSVYSKCLVSSTSFLQVTFKCRVTMAYIVKNLGQLHVVLVIHDIYEQILPTCPPPGVPDVPYNCSVSERSQVWVHVSCDAGFDGGLPQLFTAEVWHQEGGVVSNTTSRSAPSFTLTSLEPGASYKLLIYSSNVKGRSERETTLLTATLGHTQSHRRTTGRLKVLFNYIAALKLSIVYLLYISSKLMFLWLRCFLCPLLPFIVLLNLYSFLQRLTSAFRLHFILFLLILHFADLLSHSSFHYFYSIFSFSPESPTFGLSRSYIFASLSFSFLAVCILDLFSNCFLFLTSCFNFFPYCFLPFILIRSLVNLFKIMFKTSDGSFS